MVLLIKSEDEFQDIIKKSLIDLKLVVIDFFAVWCGPCQSLAPEFEKLSIKYSDKCYFGKIDCDNLPEFCFNNGVSKLPTTKAYLVGKNIFTVNGNSISKIEQNVKRYIIRPQVLALFNENIPQITKDYLLKITDNIVKNPEVDKYRQLKYSNKSVKENLMSYRSVTDLLLTMGFQAGKERYYMQQMPSYDEVKMIRNQLFILNSKDPGDTLEKLINKNENNNPFLIDNIDSDIRSISIGNDSNNNNDNPQNYLSGTARTTGNLWDKSDLVMDIKQMSKTEVVFLGKIAALRDQIQLYEDEDLINITGAIMEIDNYSLGGDMTQETILKRVLRWFKYEFFTWFNTPICGECQKEYLAMGQDSPTSEESQWLASRVELYKAQCNHESTQSIVRFPRYNHPEILVTTSRTGRCGEWANCFSLVLRVCIQAGLYSRARYVCDWSDHVWCELFMKLDNEKTCRWVHVDPCEGIYDSPLIYQQGWGKSIDYIIGVELINKDVQDITWRYTNNFDKTIKQRQLIRESLLITKLLQYHKLSGVKLEDLIAELVTFLQPAHLNQSKDECQGRTTGSIDWRLQRGECQPNEPEWSKYYDGTVIRPTEHELVNNCVHIQYNCSVDKYTRPFDKQMKHDSGVGGGLGTGGSIGESSGSGRGCKGSGPTSGRGEIKSCVSSTTNSTSSVSDVTGACGVRTGNSINQRYQRQSPNRDCGSTAGLSSSSSSSSSSSRQGPRRSHANSGFNPTSGAYQNKKDLLSHDTDGWKLLAAHWKNIQRKVEYDWQIVYLARMEGSPSYADGEVSWIIDVSDTNKVIGEISVFASSAEFNNSQVKWWLHHGCTETPVNGFVATNEYQNCTQVSLTAKLTTTTSPVSATSDIIDNNNNQLAWQFTQLCRQKSTDFDVKTLQIKVELVDIPTTSIATQQQFVSPSTTASTLQPGTAKH